uniref:Putative ovule protein n=1 Tax=Solanum chacoense TaxID=4108 RepID=A0A0V0H7U8_SOLCH
MKFSWDGTLITSSSYNGLCNCGMLQLGGIVKFLLNSDFILVASWVLQIIMWQVSASHFSLIFLLLKKHFS